MIKRNRVGSTARKPLVDISNGGKPSRISKKKNPTDDVIDGGSDLDLLLLARSELSNLFGQIDELVAQALENKRTDRKASQDIESFRNALSDIHSSLKPWISRLRQAFSTSSAAGEREDVLSFNSKAELDLVSPSPLVSWRAGARAGAYTSETGKQQHFLLTPVLKSKAAPTKSVVKVLRDTLELAPSTSNVLLETTKKDNEPRPLKCKGKNGSKGSDGFSDDALKDLTSRYQELLGLNSSRRKEANLTLDWFLSPPKTCSIMEPADEKPTAPWNYLESTGRKGKRAGESTLKKELWNRFDEASKGGLHFDASVFGNTGRKGFWDMLEEACEEGGDSE